MVHSSGPVKVMLSPVRLTLYVERILLNLVFASGLDSIGYIIDIIEKGEISFSSDQYWINKDL